MDATSWRKDKLRYRNSTAKTKTAACRRRNSGLRPASIAARLPPRTSGVDAATSKVVPYTVTRFATAAKTLAGLKKKHYNPNPLVRVAVFLKGQTMQERKLYPNIDHIFELLSRNQTPNFLEMMGAIGELVEYLSEGDINGHSAECSTLKRSGKKCRFCS